MVASPAESNGGVLTTALTLRGGEAEVLRDFTAPAISFFNNHRVPAALLAATAIKDAFVLQGRRDVSGGVSATTRSWRLVRYAYLLLMIMAFGMEISVIFMATHVGVQLGAAGGFDPVGTSLVQMLIREFEYEYVSVRAQFITGVMAFVAAQALRVRYSLRRYEDLSFCAMFSLFSATFGMLSYNNAKTITFGGYGGLVQRWIKLSIQFYTERCSLRRPMSIIAAVTSVLAVAFLVKAVYSSATSLVSEGWNENDHDSEENIPG